MSRGRTGHDEGLALVDLIACALSSVLLMVFAALLAQGGLGGTATGFALVTYAWEFPEDAVDVEAGVVLDSELLFDWKAGGFGTSKILPARTKAGGGSWSSVPGSDPAYMIFAEPPRPKVKTWEVRVLTRLAGAVVSNQSQWSFPGPKQPRSVTVRLVDQTTEGREEVRHQDFPEGTPASLKVQVDMGTLNLSTGRGSGERP